MQQITLHRKGGRKPWVFEWDEEVQGYVYKRGNTFEYFIEPPDDAHIGTRISRNTYIKNGRFKGDPSVAKQIHADYFKLGNVTITF